MRIRAVAIGLALAGLVGCGSSPGVPATPAVDAAPKPLTPAEIAARSTPAIVTIWSPTSLGTGFVVNSQGWIATSLHVIAGAHELRVVLPDKSQHPVVEIVAFDPRHDLVILRIETAKPLATLTLGDSGRVRPGDQVVAIGHPMGLEDTVSNGLVSAVRSRDPGFTILQISAPIAPGSSGGPLFNDQGEVIGVAAAILLSGQNLNFGLPVAYLKGMLEHPTPVPFERFVEATTTPASHALPRVHDVAILRGCTTGDLELVAHTLEEAIQVGAPLYNDGHFASCYHVYEGASLDAERRIHAACVGPKKALGDGRRKAAALSDPKAQAWAMRDAFDGLFEVIVRKARSDDR